MEIYSRLVILCSILALGSYGYPGGHSATNPSALLSESPMPTATNGVRYRLDPSRSSFIAHAFSGGLLWFKGHDHLIGIPEFEGEASVTPDGLLPASLELTAKASAMGETSAKFTEEQKKIINKELKEIVLEPAKYPDIVFRSTTVAGKREEGGQYDVKITGNLTLHGVTRQVTIPAKVTLNGGELRAQGEFKIQRSDFGVKSTKALHGLVRVRNKVKFTFDIVGRQI
jgi:polyisoprenoid-binding protein YceI